MILRADGSTSIGIGHVIRSLALAEMLIEDFEVVFAIRNPLPGLRKQILDICDGIIELPEGLTSKEETDLLCEKHIGTSDTVVLDGYNFRTDYQNALRSYGCKLVCIDDIMDYHFTADAVINHAGGIPEDAYSGEDHTKYFLGPSYALLRKPFREAAGNVKATPAARKLLICMGGADPNNYTAEVLQKCLVQEEIEKIFVIAGEAYPWKEELKKLCTKHHPRIEVLSNLSAEEMAHYMQQCTEAVTPPSTISYEFMSIGGILYLKQIADNQSSILAYLTGEGMAFHFDEFPVKDNDRISKSHKLQHECFDGRQGKRLRNIFTALQCSIRNATAEDADIVYEWVNNEDTRKQSYNQEPIKLSEHTSWFGTRMKKMPLLYYIAEMNNRPCGQVRFRLEYSTASISYLVAPEFRGRGLGKIILEMGIDQLRKNADVSKISGHVKENNTASRKVFTALGFRESISADYPESMEYTLEN